MESMHEKPRNQIECWTMAKNELKNCMRLIFAVQNMRNYFFQCLVAGNNLNKILLQQNLDLDRFHL